MYYSKQYFYNRIILYSYLASNKNSNPSSSIGSPVPLAPAVTSADSAATLLNSDMSTSQTKIVPKVLSLSDQDKKVVKEKLGQIYHLFPKINGLVNTISSLGTKADVLQIQRLINIVIFKIHLILEKINLLSIRRT